MANDVCWFVNNRESNPTQIRVGIYGCLHERGHRYCFSFAGLNMNGHCGGLRCGRTYKNQSASCQADQKYAAAPTAATVAASHWAVHLAHLFEAQAHFLSALFFGFLFKLVNFGNLLR